MQKHYSYQVSHVSLEKELDPLQNSIPGSGYYLVFWWKNIALGHFFLEPSTVLTLQEYYDKIWCAIQATVEYYSKIAGMDNYIFKELFSDQKLHLFRENFENIISEFVPDQVPEVVPVSIIICTRNRSQQLKRCLKMLSTLTCKASEVIVVDNCPDDSTSKDVVKQFKDYIYILEPRVGLDFARNTGIIHVNSPVLAFLDDDVVVHPLWIYNIWQTFNDSSIAAMTGLIIATELKTEAQVIFEKHWSFNRGYINKIYDDNYFKSTFSIGPPVWKIGAGANMAFRTKVFDKVGLFDEILGPGAAGCNDDSEMWFRILANGFKIHYNPRAIVFHEHRSTIKELKSQIYYYMRGFVTAALLQQRQHQKIGYKKHIFLVKPIYYLKLIRRGFPNYDNRYSTLTVELKGMISGLFYYYRNKKRSSNTVEFVDV